MSDARYKIVFEGELMPGVALETVKENLAKLFKSDASKIDSLFGGRPVALKRDLEEVEADKYLAALQRAGAQVRKEQDLAAGFSLVETEDHPNPETLAAVEAEQDTGTMTCPKCGHEQTKSVECQACGIIIEKYLARQAQLAESAPATASAVAGTATSPYATPQAQVGEALPQYCELRPFGITGRIGRVRYLAWSFVFMVALLVVIGVGAGIGFAIHPVVGGLLAAVLGIAAIVVSVQINVQRLHDIGWSGWLYLLNFVPIVGSVFPLLLLFIPGTTGVNRFGPPPPPNTTAVKVLAWMWLVIPVVFGILAAISIPAYQDYVERSEMSSYEAPVDGEYAEPTEEGEYVDPSESADPAEAEAPADQEEFESN